VGGTQGNDDRAGSDMRSARRTPNSITGQVARKVTMIHFYDCEFSDLGVQFASPHSFRSVRNSQTTRKHLFASHAKGVAANSQAQTDARDTEFARELVCGQISVCGYRHAALGAGRYVLAHRYCVPGERVAG
jgi:hypothetical protein